jgi:hypothetical protein
MRTPYKVVFASIHLGDEQNKCSPACRSQREWRTQTKQNAPPKANDPNEQFYAPREFGLVAFVADRLPYRTGGRGAEGGVGGNGLPILIARADIGIIAARIAATEPSRRARSARRGILRARQWRAAATCRGYGGNRDSDNYWGTDWDRRKDRQGQNPRLIRWPGPQGRTRRFVRKQHITLLCPRADDTREPYRAPLRLGLRCLGTVLTPHLDWPPALSPFLGHDLRRCSSNMGVGGDDARGGNELPDIRASISGG